MIPEAGSSSRTGVRLMPRSSRSDLRWHALLNDFRKSGMTHAAFCQLRGVSLHTFRKRLYQSHAPETPSAPADPPTIAGPTFLPVTVLADPLEPAPGPLELILPHGRRVAVAPGFDTDTLRRLLSVLEGPPCSD
jgi:hypothetical protein